MVLFLDPQFGPLSVGSLAAGLPGAVVWPASTARTVVGVVQAAQTLEELDADGRSWDAVVGLGFGAGPAVALVREGRARRAILIDPATLLTGDVELAQAAMDDVPAHRRPDPENPPLQDLDPAGPWPSELYEDMARQLADDPDVQARYARAWREAEEARQPYDLGLPLRPSPELKRRMDWLDIWTGPAADIEIWLPSERDHVRRFLTERAPDRPLVQQPWSPLWWLADPEAVASDLRRSVRSQG